MVKKVWKNQSKFRVDRGIHYMCVGSSLVHHNRSQLVAKMDQQIAIMAESNALEFTELGVLAF